MSLTSRDKLEQIASGFTQARILLTAVELDIFSYIGNESLDTHEIAELIGAPPGSIDRLLNALAGLKILTKKDGIFKNSKAALLHLTKDGPEPLMDMMLHRNRMWKSWSDLTKVVKSGKAKRKKMSKKDEKNFIRGMANISATSAPQTAKLLSKHLKKAKRLLDVGGGPGVYSCEFAKLCNGLNVTVMDLAGPLMIAKETIKEYRLKGRVKVKACDAIEARSYGKGYDIVFSSNFIHCFKHREAAEIIMKSAKALKKGGLLIIKDFYTEKEKTAPPFAATFSINMLVADAGDLYSYDEIDRWFKDSGIKTVSSAPVASNSQVIVGRKG